MNRIDRTLGILLLLRGGAAVPAVDLARRFEVSIRTIYRDIEALSLQGVPVYSEMGRKGGFKLREGYFLPPVVFGAEEAVTMLLGLIVLKRLRVMPFPEEADFAERKLMAILPEQNRERMERISQRIGFEKIPIDIFHREKDDPQLSEEDTESGESAAVSIFLRALLERSRVRLRYKHSTRGDGQYTEVEPYAILWDRDRWYLSGRKQGSDGEPRLWRADRIVEMKRGTSITPTRNEFDVADLLDRKWLKKAMRHWIEKYPARIALTKGQADLLKRDWYYGTADFEEAEDGRIIMRLGEDYPEIAVELIRWLGPGAELLEPVEWRSLIVKDLRAMLEIYDDFLD